MRTLLRLSMSAVVAVAAVGSLVGCTPAGTDSASAGTSPTGQPEKITSTIYFVSGADGKKEYLTADDPLVAAVTDVVTRQAEATDDRSGKGIDFSKEYKYYTPRFSAQVKKDQKSVQNFYRSNGLTTNHVGIFWFQMSFDPSRNKSTVEMVDQFKYSKAPASYYAKTDLRPTTVVAQQRTYSLSLVDGKWTIDDVEASKEMTQSTAQPTSTAH